MLAGNHLSRPADAGGIPRGHVSVGQCYLWEILGKAGTTVFWGALASLSL